MSGIRRSQNSSATEDASPTISRKGKLTQAMMSEGSCEIKFEDENYPNKVDEEQEEANDTIDSGEAMM